MPRIAEIHRNSLSENRPYIAQLFGVGASYHSTEKAARAGLAKLRTQYRQTRASGMPNQTIARVDCATWEFEEIYSA